MAGGLGSFAINYCSGEFFDWAAGEGLHLLQIRRQSGRLYDCLLHLRRGQPHWLVHHEGPRSEVQTHRTRISMTVRQRLARFEAIAVQPPFIHPFAGSAGVQSSLPALFYHPHSSPFGPLPSHPVPATAP